MSMLADNDTRIEQCMHPQSAGDGPSQADCGGAHDKSAAVPSARTLHLSATEGPAYSFPMISNLDIRLATRADAAEIATMSRDYIEQGLPWTWTEPRVAFSIASKDTNVVVAREAGIIVGFGIMSYPNDDAHLLLFAVRPESRRRGVGSAMLSLLEAVGRELGVRRIRVECRCDNVAARNFYCESGYHELAIHRRMYRGVADGVSLQKWLPIEDSA